MDRRSFSLVMNLLVALIVFMGSCSGGDSMDEPMETDVFPINLTWSINVVGANDINPYGDGTGVVVCKASAINAVRYGFKFGDGEILESTTGELQHTFTEPGIKEHTISVFAYSSTDNIISISRTAKVHFTDPGEGVQGLAWSDEFNVDGPVSSSNWFSEIVPPVNGGWFNGEQQHYTNRTDNAYVSNGTLKIVAKKESYTAYNSTKNYTSARLNSEFAFTYGRIEVRAKLPEGGGTWPAIWTLGSNITSVGWPACGEIDIMEHVGNNVGRVSSAIHTPSSNGNTVNIGVTNISNTTSEFHIYTADWTADKIDFYVDDTLFYTYNPSTKDGATWPFDKDQFILLNIAMGGALGGNIDANFVQATMEIDYVRVYK